MTKTTTTDAKVYNTGAADAQGDTDQRETGQQSLFDLVAEFGGADNAEDITDLEGFIDAISQAETAYAEALHQDPSDTQYAEADSDYADDFGFADAEALANDHGCNYDCDCDAQCTDVRVTRIVIDPAAVAQMTVRALVGVLAIGSIGYFIGIRAGRKD